jgi:hypothetical protein
MNYELSLAPGPAAAYVCSCRGGPWAQGRGVARADRWPAIGQPGPCQNGTRL